MKKQALPPNNDLATYETYTSHGSAFVEWLFNSILVIILSTSMLFGLYLTTIEPSPQKISKRIKALKAQFLIQEKKEIKKKIVQEIPKPEKKEEPKEKKKEKVEEEPIDLTEKPELKQKEDDIQKPKEKKKKKVRRIYGLKKVYSKGIGSGGALSDAVIGKLGNTLKKEVDTITASEEELKGDVVSVTTVTRSAVLVKRVKPEYTKEMIDNAIEGVISVKILVDIDGKVKKVLALNNLGFGTAESAMKACLKLRFEPALRDGLPVAVWITFKMRFELLG